MRPVSPVFLLCAVLLSASVFFGVGAERKRGNLSLQSAGIKTGDTVRLAAIVDGDSLVVKTSDGAPVQIRILGIKSFDAGTGQDEYDRVGRQAVDTIRSTIQADPLRVVLGDPPKDSHNRYLATLLLHDRDVGLELVRLGLALTYTAFPFPAMQTYLQAQRQARKERVGLWASDVMTERADQLMRRWAEGER